MSAEYAARPLPLILRFAPHTSPSLVGLQRVVVYQMETQK
jgi:hypothetical protein